MNNRNARRKREKGTEKIFEGIFPRLMSDTNHRSRKLREHWGGQI